MINKTTFQINNALPLYRQLMEMIIARIRTGEYSLNHPLPSLNAMSLASGLSKETVVKAYSLLLQNGIINSIRGKGYYIRESFLSGRPSVLVLMDKPSQHQQSILDGFTEGLYGRADITVRMHYQNPDWFASELDEVLDKYDWYLVFPHFDISGTTRERVLRLINKIPANKLIVLDRLVNGIPAQSGASYQSIEEDIPSTLENAVTDIRNFSRIRYISLSISLYGNIVADVLQRFCSEKHIPCEILPNVPKSVEKGDLFYVSGSRLDRKLSDLLRIMLDSKLKIGKDIGLICYNDFPLNEFIMGGLTTLSTDFTQMGRVAADMILQGRLTKIHCPCTLIRRSTF